ncbi:MAG TPA: hypothetical protein DGR79_08195, partial [Clostridiales bacterium]|nr:hypothetical protein [Clostridiales bacterium]
AGGSRGAGTLRLLEVGAGPQEALVEVLRWAAERAAASGLARVEFTGPPDHPFSRLARLRASACVTVGPGYDGGVSVTNRGLLLADIAGALAARAEAAGVEAGTQVVLDVGPKRMSLTFAGGRVRLVGGRAGSEAGVPVTRLSPQAFTLMVTGWAGGTEVGMLPGTTVAAEHRQALSALFPVSYPHWVPAPYW